MRIVLMRHGKPLLEPQVPISSLDFKYWIDAYNSAELCNDPGPSSEVIDLALSCNAVVCSNLYRSIRSSALLGVKEIYKSDIQFREMEMPWGKLTNVQLKPKYWSVIFRILWFCGYANNSESFTAAKLRAMQVAADLESMAKEKQSVLFVGHGMLNTYTAKYLRSRGWKIKNRMGSNYWQFGIFEY